jgi:hypothetical protein
MRTEVRVAEVKRSETRTGNTRWVVRDENGTEYTTFRPRIGEEAERHRGRRALLQYHEEDRNGFHNVYLDGIEPLPHDQPAGGDADDEVEYVTDSDPDEVAWSTAVEAAPWLLGSSEPKKPLSPDELYDRLEPFKRRVADDIRAGRDEDEDEDAT